jgi:curved DNA-binding protein CbpA
MNFNRRDLYQILELPNFASSEKIKLKYRQLALKYHPDRGGDEEKMKLINMAYNILKERKIAYDIFLKPQPAVIIKFSFGYGSGIWSEWTSSASTATGSTGEF